MQSLTGSHVLFAFGPISESHVDYDAAHKTEQAFYAKMREKEVPLEFINTMDDGLMDLKYFFDNTYHLSTEGAEVFTQMLAEKIRPHLTNE